MAYWRMQLHPAEPGYAFGHSVESLAAGFIGLDFATDVGDLRIIEKSSIPSNQRNYWGFAHDMQVGEWVLIMSHHYPVALTQIKGDYNYIRHLESGIPVWFRHFRSVHNTMYYADFAKDIRKWEPITAVETIIPLHETDTKSYKLIEQWLGTNR